MEAIDEAVEYLVEYLLDNGFDEDVSALLKTSARVAMEKTLEDLKRRDES